MNPNELIIVIFVLVTLVIVVPVVYYQSRWQNQRLAHQAEKRGGEIHKGNFFKVAELWIPFKGETIIIHMEPGSRHSSPKTVAQMNLDAARLPALRMIPNGLWQKAMASFGQERVTTIDEEFDRQWVVRSEDDFAARKLATPDLKEMLSDRLFRHLDLRIEPQRFSMTVLALPSNNEQFDRFIDTATLIIQKFL
jgi:hypothetical protein